MTPVENWSAFRTTLVNIVVKAEQTEFDVVPSRQDLITLWTATQDLQYMLGEILGEEFKA